MPGIMKPVGYFIETLTIVADRILISSNIIEWQRSRYFFSPLFSCDYTHHLSEIVKRTIQRWLGKSIERIFRMVFLNIWIRTNPFIAESRTFAAFTHPSEKFSGIGRICLIAMATVDN